MTYNRLYRDKTKQKRYEAGLCIWCETPRDSEAQLCKVCRERQNAEWRTRRLTYKQNGICRCGKSGEIIGNEPMCRPCWFKRISIAIVRNISLAEPLAHLFQEQGGHCVYSGEVLIPGDNASVDHKVPILKGGNNNITNLQWITKDINRMKGKLTHTEFVLLCAKVAHNHLPELYSIGTQSVEDPCL